AAHQDDRYQPLELVGEDGGADVGADEEGGEEEGVEDGADVGLCSGTVELDEGWRSLGVWSVAADGGGGMVAPFGARATTITCPCFSGRLLGSATTLPFSSVWSTPFFDPHLAPSRSVVLPKTAAVDEYLMAASSKYLPSVAFLPATAAENGWRWMSPSPWVCRPSLFSNWASFGRKWSQS